MEIRIFPTDTSKSLFVRIAAKLESIPEYIYLVNAPIYENHIIINSFQESQVDIQEIKKKDTFTTQVSDLYTAMRTTSDSKKFGIWLKENLQYFRHFNPQKILEEWIFLNNDYDENLDLIVFSQISDINKILGENYKINDIDFEFEKKKAQLTTKLLNSVIENANLAVEIEESYRDVGVKEFTPFELEKIKYSIQISANNDTTLYTVFDNIQLNEAFPFATYQHYYKIVKKFVPNMAWITDPNHIVVKMKDGDEFSDIIILEDSGNIFVLVELTVNSETKDIIIDSILKVLNMPKIKDEIVNIKGVFYFPHQRMNKYVFSHLVMNNINFSSIVIDEGRKAMRDKSGIYAYYFGTDNELINLIITPKIVDRFDPSMKAMDKLIFPEGDDYVRIRISTKNSKIIPTIQNSLGRMINLYNLEEKGIITYYQTYIPTFNDEKKEGKKLGKKSEGKDSRRCSHQPIVVNTVEEAKNYADYMIFPLPEDNTSRIYVCDTSKKPKEKHIGVQYRKDTETFEPCCFFADQKTKDGSGYNKYMKYLDTGELPDKAYQKQQRLIKTKKFLTFDDMSPNLVHKKVEDFFRLVDRDDIIRMGTYRSKMSFLNCLIREFNTKDHRSIESTRTIKQTIASKPGMLSMVKQFMPQKTIDEIKDDFLHDATYIDPRIYTRLFEEYFNCNIYTFNENGMITPSYSRCLIDYKISRPKTMFIIEHFGAESDNAQYPQCEILAYEHLGSVYYAFDNNSKAVSVASRVFQDLTNSYFMGVSQDLFELPSPYPKKQVFDEHGKVSAFYFENNIFAYTRKPFPPLPIVSTTDTYYHKQTLDMIKKVFRNFEDTGHGYVITESYIIPYRKLDTELIYIEKEDSLLTLYNNLSKLSKYILEYTFYAFSRFLGDKEFSIDLLSKFAHDKIKVKGDTKYGYISKVFNNLDGIYDGDTLFIPNREIVKRCMYVLRDFSIRFPEKLKEYKNKKNIPSTYDNITDFKKYPNQVMLYADSTYLKYVTELISNDNLFTDLWYANMQPVLYKFNGMVYIMQNTDTHENAIRICSNWTRHLVNSPNTNEISDFTLIKYSRDDGDFRNEKFEIVNGIDTECKILAYRIGKIPRYSCLLSLRLIK